VIIRSVSELKRRFNALAAGDVFCGIVAAGPAKEKILIDLLTRGVHCLPAPLAQTLNGSKAAQALVLGEYMLPTTAVVMRRKDLFGLISAYNRKKIGAVITKEDRMHCGRGVRRWDNIETLYSFRAMDQTAYPFVIQPFQESLTDVRVIVVDDFVEAYVRSNPDSFRANISAGGKSRPYEISPEQERLCRAVMQRGRFPYAHIDLHLTAEGRCYLSEIAFNGGIRGARIDRDELERRKKAVIDRLIAELS
jgi:ribosomal protein S6--L-glutamate ligase